MKSVPGSESMRQEMEQRYLNCIASPHVSKIVLNITEYLIEQANVKEAPSETSSSSDATTSQIVSFWLRLSMAYHEKANPQNLDRFLMLLGLFYATNNKVNTAE